MALIVDNDMFDYDLVSPTPRASNFPPIIIPTHHYPADALSPYASTDTSLSEYSSSSPQSPRTDYSPNTSVSMSPLSLQLDLPQDVEDYSANLNFAAPLSKPSRLRARSRSRDPPRKGDPSYIPRPENAFILFRKDAVAKMRAAEAAEAELQQQFPSSDKAEKGKRQRQADMSKNISHLWKSLPKEERAHWEERAAQIKRDHEAKHPDYRYQPARPGTNPKRSSNSKGKSRLVRSKRSESQDSYGGLSEDLSVVVRAQRGPRRSSVSSNASSASIHSMTLPSVPGFSRSEASFPADFYERPMRGSRQWVQPPADDPSPPPSEMYFPRGNAAALAEYNGGIMALEPSPMIDTEVRAPNSHRRRHSNFVPSDIGHRSGREEGGAVFVEPITSDRNPWTPGGAKHPATPRRGRGNRPRSHSQPVRPEQSSAMVIQTDEEEPQFDVNLGWPHQLNYNQMSPGSSDDAYSSDSHGSLDSPWTPQYHRHPAASFQSPATSSPESDCHNEFPPFEPMSDEEWLAMLEPHSMQLAAQFADDPTGMFGFQAFQPHDEDDMSGGFTVANLDSEGRSRSFF